MVYAESQNLFEESFLKIGMVNARGVHSFHTQRATKTVITVDVEFTCGAEYVSVWLCLCVCVCWLIQFRTSRN